MQRWSQRAVAATSFFCCQSSSAHVGGSHGLTRWFSARKIAIFALVAFLAGALASAFAVSFWMALVGRAVQGLGTGLVLPLMFAMVLEVIPPHRIGSAMGVNALVIMSASAIGPTLAGVLIAAFS